MYKHLFVLPDIAMQKNKEQAHNKAKQGFKTPVFCQQVNDVFKSVQIIKVV